MGALDKKDLRDLDNIVKEFEKNQIDPYKEKRPRYKYTEADDNTVNKFIENTIKYPYVKKRPGKYIRPALWEACMSKVKRGQSVTWSGKLINPPKLNINIIKETLKGVKDVKKTD